MSAIRVPRTRRASCAIMSCLLVWSVGPSPVRADEPPTWAPTAHPSPRDDHALAYDGARQVAVLFGGYDGSLLGDTWEWNGTAWTLRATTGPSARDDHAMTYDSARGVTVLFGGFDGAVNGETWEWDGVTWRLRSTYGPSPRVDHAMAYDSARGVVVLFGGRDGTYNGETWEWDGAAWTRRATTGPDGRLAPAMAYDGDRGVTVLFGGRPGAQTGETWEWDGATWTQRATTGPSAQNSGAMAFDSDRGVTVLLGGRDEGTWEWDGRSWKNRESAGPSARFGHALVYDAARAECVLFGGWDGPFNGETWAWDGAAWTLRAGSGPSARWGHAMVHDSARDVTVLFGGYDRVLDGETWEFDGQEWSLRATDGPSRRYAHALAYDPMREVTVLFGGYTTGGLLSGETWEWDGEVWTRRATTGPSPRRDHAMVYDAVRRVIVLFGGYDGEREGDTWEWDGREWVLRATTGPSARREHAMVHDDTRDVTVLFGGEDADGFDGETWEWDGARWVLRSDTGPAPRSRHAMAYSAALGGSIVLGGFDDDLHDDTWSWDGQDWTQSLELTPTARADHALAYDDARSRVVLFGGWAGGYDGVTWQYGLIDTPCTRDPDWVCDGDVDGNGTVNPLDVGAVMSAFCAAGLCPGEDLCQYDLDCSGAVNPTDAGIVLSLLGTCNAPRPPCNVPRDFDGDRIPDRHETNDGQFIDRTHTGTDPRRYDTDGDGIGDGDEVYGTLDGLNLPALGAEPLLKDIFVEVDWMDDAEDCAAHSHRPTADAVTAVVDAFAASPVANPYDGPTGVTLHVDYGQGAPFTGGTNIGNDPVVVFGAEFDQYRDQFFNPNREKYFHYAIFCHRHDAPTDDSSGVAELNADDFLVSLQCSLGDAGVSSTLMHALGHNLNLRHGGNEDRNGKPNYNSVMNDRYQFDGVDDDCDARGDGTLDYSVGMRLDLDELHLDETQGVCGAPGIDWDGGGLQQDVAWNINCLFGFSTPCGDSVQECYDTTCDTLRDYDDWSNVIFDVLHVGELTAQPIIACQDTP